MITTTSRGTAVFLSVDRYSAGVNRREWSFLGLSVRERQAMQKPGNRANIIASKNIGARHVDVFTWMVV